jgi:hypothetical protein
MHTPPANPDIKNELKAQLLTMAARSFEFFAGDFLEYVGLEEVAVTRYIGDGGIDAHGNLVAGPFRIPVGVQVKRHRNNVHRSDIDKFIGALSGHFPQGVFMTTADYAPAALQKAATSIPRILTLNGDQIVSVMIEHHLGLKASPMRSQKLDIDPDYFAAFEAMRGMLSHRVSEARQKYSISSSQPESNGMTDEQSINLRPEDDLISLNTLGYTLRVDPNTLRRWIEHEKLLPDDSQRVGERSIYYFRRDRIKQLRESLGLKKIPASADEWKQEFLDFTKSRNLSRSYKPVLLKAFFKLVDREGKVRIDDLVREFKDYYVQQWNVGQPLERDASIMALPAEAGNEAIKKLLIDMPIQRFLIKNFMQYSPEEGILRIAPQLWQELHYYEVIDALRSIDEQISYYISRVEKKRVNFF